MQIPDQYVGLVTRYLVNVQGAVREVSDINHSPLLLDPDSIRPILFNEEPHQELSKPSFPTFER